MTSEENVCTGGEICLTCGKNKVGDLCVIFCMANSFSVKGGKSTHFQDAAENEAVELA